MFAAHSGGSQFGEIPMSISISYVPRLASGAMVGSYRIDRLIGVGGMDI
jgi:hypothetical protein